MRKSAEIFKQLKIIEKFMQEIENKSLARDIIYTVNEDLSVDVKGNVFMDNISISILPIQFGIIDGYFSIASSSLSSTKGFPREVRGHLWCDECAGKFTEADILKVCNVEGKICV